MKAAKTTVEDIRHELAAGGTEQFLYLYEKYKDDPRKSIQRLLESQQRKYDAFNAEQQRLESMLTYERKYYAMGMKYIAGIDEVGRGPLAGPVLAAAVILPENCCINGINDSKKLSAEKRERLYDEICSKALAISFAMEDNKVIDNINILNATLSAMRKAVEDLSIKPQVLLIDALKIPDLEIRQEGIIKGDEKSASIAAASIIAKCVRDRLMLDLSKSYPQYGFEQNKGYGTQAHLAAIAKYGISPIHRRSFTRRLEGADRMI